MDLFVSGIGTEVGKTVVSAALVRKLDADYWKPVQSGDLHDTDSNKVQKWAMQEGQAIHPEAYRLTQPLSPHRAAELDGVSIKLSAFRRPETDKSLIIEGAGGLMVPLNEKELMIDLIHRLHVPVVLVSRHYLGSINHTLLSAEALKSRNIPVKGIVFNGEENTATENIILQYTGLPCLGRLPLANTIDADFIKQCAEWIHLS